MEELLPLLVSPTANPDSADELSTAACHRAKSYLSLLAEAVKSTQALWVAAHAGLSSERLSSDHELGEEGGGNGSSRASVLDSATARVLSFVVMIVQSFPGLPFSEVILGSQGRDPLIGIADAD